MGFPVLPSDLAWPQSPNLLGPLAMSRENEAGSRVTGQVTVSLVNSHHFMWVRRGKQKSEGTVPPSASMCDDKSRAGAQRQLSQPLSLEKYTPRGM